MKPDDLLRAVRDIHRLSQRELAERAEVPRSTVDRIESGRSRDPGIAMIDRILGSVGFRLAVLNQHGRELQVRGDRFRLHDRGGRHLPAHLEPRPIRGMRDPWWGWFRIAWLPDDPRRNPAVPPYTFDRRHPEIWDDPLFLDRRWNDAT